MRSSSTHHHYLAVEPTPSPDALAQIKGFLSTPSGMTFAGLLVFVAFLFLLTSDSKGKLAFGYWGGGGELKRARLQARKKLVAPFLLDAKRQKLSKSAKLPGPKRNASALWIGTPKDVRLYWNERLSRQHSDFVPVKPGNVQTLYFPDANRGFSVVGAAGSGKTFSAIDPMIRSSLDQGFPTIIYDFKYPSQTKRHVAYALRRGYQVRVFAPGMPESDTMNILDFMRDERDAVAAEQLSQTIIKNASLGQQSSEDPFFGPAATTLVQGIFLLAKFLARKFNDPSLANLMFCQALLNLPDLPNRLYAARDALEIDPWTYQPLSQIVSLKGSAETTAGVIGGAQKIFQTFLKQDFIGAFCGQSDLPLDLDGKVLLVFGLDRNNRFVVGPLLAAILHMVVSRNVSRTIPRKDPLAVFIDELPTLYLPQLVNWLAENREDGFLGVLGYQNLSQLKESYGDNVAQAIFGNTATKLIFNPQDSESAKLFADYLGEEDIQYKSKSRSSGKGGGSSSTSDNLQKRGLMDPNRWLKMPAGQAIAISPAYTHGNEAYVPVRLKFKIPKFDLQEQDWAADLWDRKLRDVLINKKSGVVNPQVLADRMGYYQEFAEKTFPPPEPGSEKPAGTPPLPAIGSTHILPNEPVLPDEVAKNLPDPGRLPVTPGTV